MSLLNEVLAGGTAGGAAVQQSGPVQPASHSHAPHGEASVAVHVPRPEHGSPSASPYVWYTVGTGPGEGMVYLGR